MCEQLCRSLSRRHEIITRDNGFNNSLFISRKLNFSLLGMLIRQGQNLFLYFDFKEGK